MAIVVDTNGMTTTGQALTGKLRSYFSVGPRTRRYRKGTDLHAEMVEAINMAAQYPDYYAEQTQATFTVGFAAAQGYIKHILGYRAAPTVTGRVNNMTAYQFAAFLGQMVDAGITNNGEAERYLQEVA